MPSLPARRIALGALVLAVGCDVPTAIPRWQETWNLPAKSATIPAASLLPVGVRVTPDSAAFSVAVAPVSLTRALVQDCAACAAASGTVVVKPAFTMMLSDSAPLPAGLDSAELASDTVVVRVANGLSFDPLRPSATARGFVVLTLSNGPTALARDSVDGATIALPPGDTLVRRIALAGRIAGGAPLRVAATIVSPQGDSATMDSTQSVSMSATLGDLRLTSAQLKVRDRNVSATPVTLDLSGIGGSLASRVQSGTLRLDMTNPFAVQGPATLYITAGMSGGRRVTLSRSLPLSDAAESTNSVAFSQAEMQQLLGARLVLQMAGVVTGPSGVVSLRPRQVVDVDARFEIVVNTASGQ